MAGNLPSTVAETFGAVDVGTNSLHLVVARTTQGERFEVLTREKEMVRLGQGSREMKHMSDEAMDRAVLALARFRAIAESFDAPLRAVATSAVREAENRKDFLRRALKEANVEVEVVSGVEEARLIYLGVLQGLEIYDTRVLLCDIGGGSTELLIGESGKTLSSTSLKLGSLRLTNRFFADSGLHPSAVESCRRYIAARLASFDRAVDEHPPETVIGSSGTIEQVCRLSHGLQGREPMRTLNAATVSREQVDEVVAALIRARHDGTTGQLSGLDPKRSDIVLGGTLVLEGVMERFHLRQLTISEYALREGIFLDTIQRRQGSSTDHLRDVAMRSVMDLQAGCDDDPAHSQHVASLALQLWDETADIHGGDDSTRTLLEAGALLANVGLAISHSKHHQHSYYLIRNSDRLVGFSDHEIELIAQVARYHRKSAPKSTHCEWAALEHSDRQRVLLAASVLRVAIGLDRSHRGLIKSLNVKDNGEKLQIFTRPKKKGSNVELERWSGQQRARLLSEVLQRDIEVIVG